MDINNSFEAMKEILSKTFNIPARDLEGVDKLNKDGSVIKNGCFLFLMKMGG